MALACASYAHYIEADVAPESAAIQVSLFSFVGEKKVIATRVYFFFILLLGALS